MIEDTPVSKALRILSVHNIVEVIRFSCNVQWKGNSSDYMRMWDFVNKDK